MSAGNSFGIYLDDCSYGFHIENNIVYDLEVPVHFNLKNNKKKTLPGGRTILMTRTIRATWRQKAGMEEPYRSLLPGNE